MVSRDSATLRWHWTMFRKLMNPMGCGKKSRRVLIWRAGDESSLLRVAGRHATGIRLTVRTVREADQNDIVRLYQMSIFEVSTRGDTKRGAARQFRIETLGYKVAWQATAKWLAQLTGLEDYLSLATRMLPMLQTPRAWAVPESMVLYPISTQSTRQPPLYYRYRLWRYRGHYLASMYKCRNAIQQCSTWPAYA